MNKSINYLAVFLMSACLSSCSFYRLVTGKGKTHDKKIVLSKTDSTQQLPIVPQIVIPKMDTVVKAPDTSVLLRQLIEQLTPVWKNRLVYKTFTGKAKMHFTGPDSKQEFTAHFRIRKDSVIWINITAALGGISVARVFVTADSLFMINYLEKSVTRIPLTNAAKVLPAKVDFASLQNLVIGEPLRDGTITSAKDFGGAWTLQVEDSSYIQHITYNKSDSTIRTGQLRTYDPNGPQAMTEYGSYINTGNGRISTGRVLNLQNGNDVYSLDMNFSRIDFDQPLEFPFSIPESYNVKQ